MRAHEIVQEIEYSSYLTKDSMHRGSEMKHAYNRATKKGTGENYDIPEFPDHTIEVFSNTRNTIVFLVSDDTEEVVAIVELSAYSYIPGFYQIDGVKILAEYQGRRIGPTLYKFIIVDLGINLVSDSIQSPGAAKLWANLSREPKIQIVAYYPRTKKTSPVTYDRASQRLRATNLKSINNIRIYSENERSPILLLAYRRQR